eukprot:scaffold74968_cov57-Cyclotella_meneghiniana.AAC.7
MAVSEPPNMGMVLRPSIGHNHTAAGGQPGTLLFVPRRRPVYSSGATIRPYENNQLTRGGEGRPDISNRCRGDDPASCSGTTLGSHRERMPGKLPRILAHMEGRVDVGGPPYAVRS